MDFAIWCFFKAFDIKECDLMLYTLKGGIGKIVSSWYVDCLVLFIH